MSATAPDPKTQPILPPHIEDTIRAIADLHAEHRRGATPTEKILQRLTAFAARPRFLAGLTFCLAAWIAGNILAEHLGGKPLDPPPFPWAGLVVSTGALYVTAVILATQRREDQLSNLREQLTLELAILSEQKTAKTIQLLEEMRRDNPIIPNRVDLEADAMALPANPQSVLEAIKNTEAEAERLDGADESTTSEREDVGLGVPPKH